MDLNADLDAMGLEELLEHQQALTRHRLEVLDAQRRVQGMLDYRADEISRRRSAEDQLLGAAGKPPAQDLFATSESRD